MASPPSSARVSLNIGGRRFETTVGTLGRDPESMLARLCAPEWRPAGGEAAFVDRDPTHFPVILNFLRDGAAAALPEATSLAGRELLREAEFYGLEGLASSLRADALGERPLRVGDIVGWRPDAVDLYWKPFALSLIQEGVELGFLYERVGRKYSDKQTVATCIACLNRFVLDQITVFDYKLRFEEWEPLRHHMKSMRGMLSELVGAHCAVVAWANGKRLHTPLSAVAAAPPLAFPHPPPPPATQLPMGEMGIR